jgi:hypothetical protein
VLSTTRALHLEFRQSYFPTKDTGHVRSSLLSHGVGQAVDLVE